MTSSTENVPTTISDQLAFLREQVMANAGEVRALKQLEAAFHQGMEAENAERQKLEMRLKNSMKTVVEEVDAAYRGLQAEVADRTQEQTERCMAVTEERLTKTGLRDRGLVDEVVRSSSTELGKQLEKERSLRVADMEELKQEVQKLRLDKENETKLRTMAIEKISASVQAITNNMDGQTAKHLTIEASQQHSFEEFTRQVDQEAKLRYAGDLRHEKLLEDAITPLRTDLHDETNRRKIADTALTESMQGVRSDIEVEIAERIKGDESLTKIVGVARSQVGNLQQELAAEKDERMDDVAGIRRALQSLEGNITQQLKDLRRSHEAEETERRAIAERLEKRLTEMRGSLSAEAIDHVQDRMEAENRERANGIVDLSERLKHLSDQLSMETRARIASDEEGSHVAMQARQTVEKEARERQSFNDEITRRFQELVASLEQEKGDRELGDSGMRGQIGVCRQELVAEKDARTDEIASLRRTVQGLTGQLTQQMEDIRLGVEMETNKRSAADERIERNCTELRGCIDTEEQARVEALREVERSLRSLRQSLDNEIRIRTEEITANSVVVTQLKGRVEAESLSKAVAELSERTKSLSEDLQSEVAARQAGDENTLKRIQDMNSFRDRTQDRGFADPNVRADIAFCRQELTAEKDKRMEENDAIRKSVHSLQAQIMQCIHEIRQLLEVESTERTASDERLEALCNELTSGLDTEAECRADSARDAERGLRELREALEQETKERVAGDDECTLSAAQTRDLSDDAHVRRGPSDEIGKMLRELAASLEQERGQRELGDSNVRTQLASCRQELAAEKAERVDENASLKCSFQRLEGDALQQFHDLAQRLDAETNDRTEADQHFDLKITEINEGLNAILEIKRECEAGIAELRQQTEQDLKDLAVAVDEALSLARQGKQMFEQETREREIMEDSVSRRFQDIARVLDQGSREVGMRKEFMAEEGDIHGAVKQSLDHLERHMANRLESIEHDNAVKHEQQHALREHLEKKLTVSVDRELLKSFQERIENESQQSNKTAGEFLEKLRSLSDQLAVEVSERIACVEEVVARIQGLSVAVEHERDERELGDSSTHAQLSSCRQEFVAASQERSGECTSLRRECQKMCADAIRQQEGFQLALEAEKEKRMLLQEEMKARCGSQPSSALMQLQNQTEAELTSRSRVVTDLAERVKSLADGLGFEARERRAADEEVGRRLQDLVVMFDQERGERDIAVSNVQTHLSSSLQEIIIERDSRVDETSSTVQQLEIVKEELNKHISEVQRGLEVEISVRQAADEQLNRRCSSIQSGFEEDVKGLWLLRSEIAQEANDMRSALKIEGALREAGDDVGLGLQTKIQQIEQMLQTEIFERVSTNGTAEERSQRTGDSSVVDHLAIEVQQCRVDVRKFREALEAESRARALGDESLGKSLHTFSDSLSDTLDSALDSVYKNLDLVKAAIEGEALSRKDGDAVRGEACLNLQALLEVEEKQRESATKKLEEELRKQGAAFGEQIRQQDRIVGDRIRMQERTVNEKMKQQERLVEEQIRQQERAVEDQFRAQETTSHMSLRNGIGGLEARVNELSNGFREELQREAKRRETAETAATQLAGLHSKEIGGGLDFTGLRSVVESSLGRERLERQNEDVRLHEYIASQAEGWEQETQKLWEALGSHSHNLRIEGKPGSPPQRSMGPPTRSGALADTMKHQSKISAIEAKSSATMTSAGFGANTGSTQGFGSTYSKGPTGPPTHSTRGLDPYIGPTSSTRKQALSAVPNILSAPSPPSPHSMGLSRSLTKINPDVVPTYQEPMPVTRQQLATYNNVPIHPSGSLASLAIKG